MCTLIRRGKGRFLASTCHNTIGPFSKGNSLPFHSSRNTTWPSARSMPWVRFSCPGHEAALHLEIGDHGWSSLPSPMLQSSIPTASALLQAATTHDQASTATLSCLPRHCSITGSLAQVAYSVAVLSSTVFYKASILRYRCGRARAPPSSLSRHGRTTKQQWWSLDFFHIWPFIF